MNFFDAQDQARRSSRRLVFVYLLAAGLIVLGVTLVVGAALFSFGQAGIELTIGEFMSQQATILLSTAVLSALLILGATVYKTSRLSSGGGRVARDLGGTLVSADSQDPLRRRLRNVVEEIAIASGVPVPEIYVLERESGINAFAAGYTPSDAAIAVTRGTLELLDRDELQGVIAHEFSHILNGDMRLNIRLMGILFGIMVLGIIGRMVLRGGHYSGLAVNRRSRGTPVVLIIGLGLAVLGAIGVFFARVIKASISRQREFLADASAVQFTRQSVGLANALKKIGGYQQGSHLTSADPEEVSHMLFGTGSRLGSLFATHPPLADRIRALDPNFKDTDYPVVDMRSSNPIYQTAPEDSRHAGFTADIAASAAAVSPESFAESVGRPGQEHVEYAARLRQSIPTTLYDAAHSSKLAYLLVIALILDRSGRSLERQLALAEERLGRQRARLIRNYFDELSATGAAYRLPLLEIAFPALKRRPAPQLAYLTELSRRLIEIDGEIDLYEYCFYRVLRSNLEQASAPSMQTRQHRAMRSSVRSAAIDLLRIVAQHGHDDDSGRNRAYQAGAQVFGAWATQYAYAPNGTFSASVLDQILDMLVALNSDGRQMLLEAVGAVVLADGAMSVTEAELLRAICASLECPLPPLLDEQVDEQVGP